MSVRDIDNCPLCRDHFENDSMKKAEVRHTVAKFGVQAGHALMLELMETVHEDHLNQKGFITWT